MTEPAALSAEQARELFRSGRQGHTAGWCAGQAQANLIALPCDWAFDLMLFARRNPKPCPVLDVPEPGQVTSAVFGGDITRSGIGLRHVEMQRTVPMCRTTLACRPAGRLRGPLVVSMRPVPAGRVADAVQISSRYPAVHGAPVHVGSPSELGIDDLDRPDFGEPVEVRAGEVPVFWACRVTPQAAVWRRDRRSPSPTPPGRWP